MPRGSYSKTLDSGKVTGRGSLTCPAGESCWGCSLPPPTQSNHLRSHTLFPPLPSEVKGTLAVGQIDGMQPAARQVLIKSLGLQETGAGASGCKVKGAPGVCPWLSHCSGARPAAAGHTCGAPRGALPQQLQPPPRPKEPLGGQPGVGEQR